MHLHSKRLWQIHSEGYVINNNNFFRADFRFVSIKRNYYEWRHAPGWYSDEKQIFLFKIFFCIKSSGDIKGNLFLINAKSNWFCNTICKLLYTVEKVLCNFSIQLGSSTITPSRTARNLGVVIDDQLSFTDHIATMARSCRFALYNIRKIRPFLSEQAAQLLVQALVLSRLDYCNALLAGLPRMYYQASATDPECSSQSGL